MRLKDEFLATVSHEMRTPLTAILGWIRMLQIRGDVPPAVAGPLSIVERNARLQLQLIEDLLDASRIVTGKMRIVLRRLDLCAVAREALESVRPGAATKGVALHADMGDAPIDIPGDPDRLQQVIWNLLSNAIKFTPRGGEVTLSIAEGTFDVELSVRDTGQGIAPAFMPFIFGRFYQAESGARRKDTGLGLGLAIARHLVEAHGGTIAAQSDGDGKGATFTVRLRKIEDGLTLAPPSAPPPRQPASAPSAERPPALDGLSVLVVEDDRDARELLGIVLEEFGAAVSVAASANDGLAAARERAFDVVLSDIAMPGLDGYGFVERLRTEALRPETPVAALTAHARLEDRDRALSAGFQRHIAKPVEPVELARAVAELAGRGAPARSSSM
jgi:CheY-like chemotaxis protein